jgi:hypothetical protein
MIKKSLVFGTGFLLPFVVGELVLRYVDPYDFAEHEARTELGARIVDRAANRLRPGAVGHYLGTKTTISAQGWRSPEFVVPKPAGVFRVLLLGGSVPFGWGVGDGDEYPRVLETLLNAAKLAGNRRIEVINTGVPGWRIEHAGEFLRAEGVTYQPDIVLLTLVATDVPTVRDQKQRGELFDDDIRRLRLAWAFENRYRFQTPGAQGKRYDAYDNLSPGGLITVNALLGTFQTVCRAANAKFVVFDTLGRDTTKQRCEDLGVPRIEGYTSWRLRTSWEVTATDPHPDAVGHRFLAKMIFDGMQLPSLWR